MTYWQPIETAPRDGTVVLLFMPDARDPGIDVGFWSEWTIEKIGEEGAEWADPWSHLAIDTEPTHWLPIPKPPPQFPPAFSQQPATKAAA